MIMRSAFAFAAVAAAAPLLAASPLDGTWKADMSSAKLAQVPDVYAIAGGTFACKSCTPPISVPADGKFHKVSGNPYFDEVAVTLVDPHKVERRSRRNGKAVGEVTTTISADGRTATYSFVDMSAANGVPMRGTMTALRQGPVPAGGNMMAGAWVDSAKGAQISDNAITVSYRMSDGEIHYSSPTGTSYSAKPDGTKAPVTGDPGWTAVMFRQTGPSTFVETDLRGTRPVQQFTFTVAPDGKTMQAAIEDKLRGGVSHVTFRKQ